MQWLNSTGIAVSLFFILFILGKKNRKRADYLLILINLLMISFLALDIAVRTHLSPLLFFFQTIAPYLLFPVYIFFAFDTVQENQSNRRWILLFIPALLSAFFLISDMFIIHAYDTAALQKLYDAPPISYHIMYKGNQILFLAALFWLIKRLRLYASQIKERFSLIDPIQLDWLTQTSWVYISTTSLSILIFIISNFQLLPIDTNSAYSIVSLGVVFAVFYISYHGIHQYTVAEYYGKNAIEEIRFEESVQTLAKSPEKYKTSSLTSAEQETIYQNLRQMFENRKLFLEAKLQLQEVADGLNVTTHNLSQTINSITGKPFYDFVNDYRVKHLQKLLADPTKKRFTILALGMDSGFNSKASLNRIFKAETGLSPKEYQLRNLLQ
ncbi:MAG: helix-turn-helix domain-containing protein [Cyclobacteriaceae bacterium]